jgi:crotonobetainyl-CoA:carnitine CoA-transferase CaiB-like acyl-CoA transferase
MPLEGIRVLDLTRLLPGPYCSLMLADFGADVIKIEDPKLGDYMRWSEPKAGELSAMFYSLNRNKRSMSLDLKIERNKEIFIDLVKTADVLVESFRPGVMERLGLGYEELKKHNPKLIYCAITSYGQSGPYKDMPGHDINFLSYSGLLELQGEQNRKPVSSSVQIGDIGGGALMGVIGILVSIIEAKKSGKGQFIDISMLDGAVSWMQTILPAYLTSNELPNRGELVLNGGRACYEIYETKDHRFLSVGALELKFWKNFCSVIGKEELISKLNAPDEQQNAVKEEIQKVISTKTLNEWQQLFNGVDACVAPVLTVEEMVNDPQIKDRRMIEEVYHPNLGMIRQLANPIKLSRTSAKTVSQAPGLGEHNEELFKELGYSHSELLKKHE